MGKNHIFLKNQNLGGKSHQASGVGILKKWRKEPPNRVFFLFFLIFPLFFAESYLRRLAGFRPFMAPDFQTYRIEKSP